MSERRGWDPQWLARVLADPNRPVFLIGSTPPREGTSAIAAADICSKFVGRSRTQATDGFITYDIQDEASRNAQTRPFPFRKTVDPAAYGALFPPASGKSTVLYKAIVEPDESAFERWIDEAVITHGHRTLNLVGASSAADTGSRIKMEAAARLLQARGVAFGCVTIAERHLKKGTEHLNIIRKMEFGAQWFISQAVYDPEATVALLRDYAKECEERMLAPAKIILTFAPVGRPKTLQFVRWLGIKVPDAVEARILEKANESKVAAVMESVEACTEALAQILLQTEGLGVPLGISVESVSGFKEEIDASFELFRRLQVQLLDSRGVTWGVRWYKVPLGSLAKKASEEQLHALEAAILEPKPSPCKRAAPELVEPPPPPRSALGAAYDAVARFFTPSAATPPPSPPLGHTHALKYFVAGVAVGLAAGARARAWAR
mmetsp:Transcript_24537/g.51379  ORF Transcript_24537/g.51379 Transcript_24537/m.51379 type:complete len:434 (+) Transcript_24537:187-1488(+)